MSDLNISAFEDLLNEFAEAARNNRDKGDLFERLIANYLMTDPQYADLFDNVWLRRHLWN